jgi:hypothetical protein
MFTSFDSVVVFFKLNAGFLLMFLLFYWFFERIVNKWLFELKQEEATRLWRVLGNYLAEKL